MNSECYHVRYDNWKFLWETNDIDKVQALLEERKTVKEIEELTDSRCIRSYKVTWEHFN